MNRQSVLLIGGSGFLGAEVAVRLGGLSELVQTYATEPLEGGEWRRYVVPRDDPKALIEEVQPDTAVLAARLTGTDALSLEQFETDFSAMIRPMSGTHLVYVSSDAVFEGSRGKYSELDLPGPVTLYGRKQALAEQVVRDLCASWSIVRTSFIYGESSGRLDKRTEQLCAALDRSESVAAQTRVIKSPVSVQQVAEAVAAVALSRKPGITHVPGPGMSVYQFFGQRLQDLGRNEGPGSLVPVDEIQSDTSLITR